MVTDHRLRLQHLPYKVRAGDIAIHVHRQMIGGELLHGERLPSERAFADQFGVSRATVRDALRRLERGGFVETRQRSGTYVACLDAETVAIAQLTSPLELIGTRYALEPQIVRFAVLNATEQALVKSESALEGMERSEFDPGSFSSGDEAFHLALAECTRNAMLVWITRRVSEVRKNAEWARMRQLTLSADMIRHYNAQHREIFEAVCRRDAERGAEAMRTHLELARRTLINAASSSPDTALTNRTAPAPAREPAVRGVVSVVRVLQFPRTERGSGKP